ncbi:unnamed protein product (macronuclear) [Paramecium tetraurelia]|uniref:Uncharacterized protein n=1 Tax=Paramecium tetraurelia TaxID=5888 RepID=A0D2Z1_PARTE|nr:uncharacterized protein GSPATT00012893001 [Paramecium tetraurelia]CAK77408.1 unnamed protein product [Paramecium tetraurelia]|eukprot:XP_001444805.1 hypothetical protein (macronuclear) [Paramecium tetraurelia strain d4-2]
MQNINQISARLQLNISKQLSARTDQTDSQFLNTSNTQTLLKQINLIKKSDKKNKALKIIPDKQSLKFQHLTEPKQININQLIQKEHTYEEEKKNSAVISNVGSQTWRIETQMRQSLNFQDLHKLDESIAIDILNRQIGKTETNFYEYIPKTSRKTKSQSVKQKNLINLSGTPSKFKKTNKLNNTVNAFKSTNKDQIYYKLPVSNVGVPIIKTQRIKSQPRYHHPFSTMNNFNYTRLNKSLWVSDF